jgi:hypothetical protein
MTLQQAQDENMNKKFLVLTLLVLNTRLYPAAAAAAVPVTAIVIKKSDAQQTKELDALLYLFKSKKLPVALEKIIYNLGGNPFSKRDVVPCIPGRPSRDAQHFFALELSGPNHPYAIMVRDDNNNILRTLPLHHRPIYWVHSDDSNIIVVSNERTQTTDIYKYSERRKAYELDIKSIPYYASGLQMARNGSRLNFSTLERTKMIRTWNLTNNTEIHSTPSASSPSTFSDDGTITMVPSCIDFYMVHLFNTHTKKLGLKLPEGLNHQSAISGDGTVIAGGSNNTTYVWHCSQPTLALLHSTKRMGNRYYAEPQLSRSGRYALTLAHTESRDHTRLYAAIWDTANGKLLQQFPVVKLRTA